MSRGKKIPGCNKETKSCILSKQGSFASDAMTMPTKQKNKDAVTKKQSQKKIKTGRQTHVCHEWLR